MGFQRAIWHDFLYINILGVGSLASTCEHHIGIVKGLKDSEYLEIYGIISNQIKLKSRTEKNKLVFIKEVPQSQLHFVKKVFSKDFHFYYSLPNCIIPVFEETRPYPQALKRKGRQRYNSIVNKFNNKYSWEIVNDFTDYIPQFEKLYLGTLNKSKNIFEVLNGSFFNSLNACLPDNSCMMLIKNKSGKIEAAGLIMEDEESLIPLYIGLNYDNKHEDVKILHMYSIIIAIKIAESKNKKYMKIGQTSYYPKVLSGALVEDLYLGFYSYNFIIQFFVENVFGKLFNQTKVLPNVYNNELKKVILEKVRAGGFEITNF